MQLPSGAEVAKRIVDSFLLREREKIVSLRAAEQQALVSRYHDAALARMRGARDLMYGEPVAALALYREAAILLIAALGQASQTEKVELRKTAAEAFSDFDVLERPPSRTRLPDDFATARAALANDDPLVADGLPIDELRKVTAAAAETVRWLASTFEPRSPRELQETRRLRIAAVAVVALFLLVELGIAILSPKNLALNKTASASSQRPGSPPPSGIDNGDVEVGYGFHTGVENNPWIKIDLGASLPIHEVRVYNRSDGDPSANLPLLLQVSDDDNAFSDVEERTEMFTRDKPWTIKLEGRRARYVRVTQRKQGYIALTEIEVY